MSRVRIERLALGYLATRPLGTEAPDLERSVIRGRICELRSREGQLLAELEVEGDGSVVVGWIDGAPGGFATVDPFVLVVRCVQCRRRHLENSSSYVPTALYTCPRCGAVNLRPTVDQLFGG